MYRSVYGPENPVYIPALPECGAVGQSPQEDHSDPHQQGRAAAAVRQVAGAELTLTGETAAEVKAAESRTSTERGTPCANRPTRSRPQSRRLRLHNHPRRTA